MHVHVTSGWNTFATAIDIPVYFLGYRLAAVLCLLLLNVVQSQAQQGDADAADECVSDRARILVRYRGVLCPSLCMLVLLLSSTTRTGKLAEY